MTRRGYGLIAGLAGAAFAAWYWRGRRTARSLSRDKGEVIFRNTPVPSEGVL